MPAPSSGQALRFALASFTDHWVTRGYMSMRKNFRTNH